MQVLVLNIPGLHLGYLGCYGNDWIDTPHFDRLAAEGVVFDQHIADALIHRTAWSGRYRWPTAGPAEPTNRLEQTLKTQGIDWKHLEVPLAKPNAMLKHLRGNPQGLLWIDLPSLAPPWHIPEEFLEPYFVEAEPAEEDDTDESAQEIEPLTPWLDPPVGPVQLDDRSWERLQNTYAGVVSHLDAQLGQLLDKLDESDLAEEVLLVVTSEHGLALGEHGILGNVRPWLHEERIHLPLLMRFPDGSQAGRRVGEFTQPVDLFATLLAAVGVDAPAELESHNLLPLARGATTPVREFAYTALQQGDRLEWALRTRSWSFLLPKQQAVDDSPRERQLYVKPDDRWEVNNLVQHHLELAEELEAKLRAVSTPPEGPG